MGESPAIRALRAQVRHLAAFDTPGSPFVPTLLLQGETGTGKGLLARLVHDVGPRATGPFLDVNCAAIPETLLEAELFGFEAGAFTDARRPKPGLFETASGGTLFLDEIDALPLALQGKLLTVLEAKRVRRLGAVTERPMDVKLIAATQAELGERVGAGRFRADLYHRLAVVVLHLPALRERGADVLALARHFLGRYAAGHGLPAKRLSAGAEAWLRGYGWPGNVRELGHLMERVVLLHAGEEVEAATLERLCLPQPAAAGHPDGGRAGGEGAVGRPDRESPGREPTAPEASPEPLDEPARIRAALVRTGGNVVGAARLLGSTRSAVRHRMRRYGIRRPAPAWSAMPPSSAPRTGEDTPPRDGQELESPGVEPPAADPSWEQRPVAVLVIDLAFPQLMGLEAPRYEPWTVATRWEQAIGDRVRGFGGLLLRPTASLLTAVFGLPRALEQVPQRAVQAALAIRHLVAEAAAARAEGGQPTPAVRLAVHLGAVLVDSRAADSAARLLAVGETLSLAVRLLGHARSGEILVSPRVCRLVEEVVELKPRELPSDDGQTDARGAYAVVGLGTGRARLSGRGGPARTPFVGRTRELAALHELLAQVEAGRGQVVGIVGEPGLGKSRLLAEFLRGLEGRGLRVLEGRCLSYGSPVPYLPVLDLLRQQCGLAEADPPELVADKVRQTLEAAELAPHEAAPYLLRLLGVPVGTEPLARLSPEAVKARTFETLRHLTLHASRRRPLVVVVEDLHWLDQTSEAYLAALVESLAGAPLLLLTTYRPGYRPPWLSRSYATQLALQPLSPAESRSIVQALLSEAPPADRVTALILEKAEGNPLFLEELARAVGHADRAGQIEAVPETIQDVLLARIDRLADAARRLLQTASVLGREVPRRLLAAIWHEPGDPGPALQELVRLEFLAERRDGEEPGYLFTHALTQEVAYASLLPAHRQALHAEAGRAVESLHADRLEEVVDRLAYHYARSAEADKAVAYLARVAEKAARGFAHAEAVAALEEALRHVERRPVEERDPCRLALLLRLAHSLYFLGRFQDARALLLQQQERLERLREPSLAGPYHLMLARGYNFLGEHDGAAMHARRAIETAARCGDDATGGKAHAVLALEMYWAGQPRQGITLGREAVSLLERTADRFWLGQAHRALGFNHYLLGEFERALEREAQAYAIGEAIGDPQLQSHAMWIIGWIEATRGEWAAGIAACQQGLERSLNPANTAFTLGHLGAIYLEQGDAAQAVPALEQAVQQVSTFGFQRTRGWFTTFLAEAHRLLGQLDRARELAEEGLAIARQAQCGPGVGWAQRALGRIAQARGARAEAERYLQEALETFGAMGARFEVGRTHLALAELALARGEQPAAGRHVGEARRLFQNLRVPRYLERAEQLVEEVGALEA